MHRFVGFIMKKLKKIRFHVTQIWLIIKKNLNKNRIQTVSFELTNTLSSVSLRDLSRDGMLTLS